MHNELTSVVADERDWMEEGRGGLRRNHVSGMQNRTEGGRSDDDERTSVIHAVWQLLMIMVSLAGGADAQAGRTLVRRA